MTDYSFEFTNNLFTFTESILELYAITTNLKLNKINDSQVLLYRFSIEFVSQTQENNCCLSCSSPFLSLSKIILRFVVNVVEENQNEYLRFIDVEIENSSGI